MAVLIYVQVTGYNDHPFDLVPQLVGGRALFNPFYMLGSLIMAPSLFMGPEHSVHTYPYE